jgi:hypothetical protein
VDNLEERPVLTTESLVNGKVQMVVTDDFKSRGGRILNATLVGRWG